MSSGRLSPRPADDASCRRPATGSTIADAVGTAAKAALAQAKTPKGDAAPSGTKVARRRGKASRHASAESENQL